VEVSEQASGERDVGPTLIREAEDEILPPAPASRRMLEPAQRAVLMLATQFSVHRMALLQSEPLLQALDQALKDRDGVPEELVGRLVAPGPPDPAAPVESLLRRLRAESGPTREDAVTPGWATEAARVPATAPDHAAPDAAPDDAAVDDAAGGGAASAVPRPPGAGAAGGYTPRRLARARRSTASRGWRAGLRRSTGGAVRLRPGRDEARENALIDRVQAPIDGYRHVVVLSLKGGSGKTTTTVMLGHTFATHRRDRVAAIDASPDAGTLVYRISDQPSTSVRTLLDAADGMRRYVDVRPLTGHTASRLDLVASDADPTASRPFGAAEYRRAADILARFYSLVLTDCGAGLMHEAMGSILDSADQILLVTNPAVDSARSADLTLDWLDAHGYSDLVRGCVAVVNSVERPPVVDIPEMVEHFAGRCRAVVQIPRDPHLAEGAATDLESLSRVTRRRYLVLAATVADGFEDASVRRGRTR
jgi:putative peptide zinc metalloprotease protein